MDQRPLASRRRKTIPLIVAVVIALVATAGAAPHHPVSVHLLHPLSTSPDPATSTGTRLSLLWGWSRSVSTLDLGLVATGTEGDVRGFQVAGAYAGVGGDFSGLGYTWGLHRVGGGVGGVQFGAVAAWAEGAVRGVQYGTLLGYAGGGFRGAQISAFVTINDGSGRWAQLGTVANATVGDFTGAQFSSIFNFTGGRMAGAQFAFFNHAAELSGAQVGVVNMADRASGLQLGAINVAREMDGVPVGLVILAGNGEREVVAYATNVSLINVGWRTGVAGWRSTVAGGWYEVAADQTSAGSLSWHFGRRLWGDPHRRLGLDVGLVHLIPRNAGRSEGERLHPSWQIRLTADAMVSARWGLHGAVGLASVSAAYDEEAEVRGKVLLAAGVVWR